MSLLKPLLAFFVAALIGAAAVACSSTSSGDSGNACVEV